MSNHVAAVLRSEGIAVGNKPIAVWRYLIPEEPVPQVRGREGGRERRREGGSERE